jgi:tyrosyl-tRNA synthetase
MQGYDSYFMDTDIQLGGTDQTFNMQAGRTLQKDIRQKQSFVMTNVLMEGTDGRKMSKSWGNAIWLDDTAEDIYAKVMAITDALIIQYYTLGTNVPLTEVDEAKNALKKGEHPMTIKKQLAFEITKELTTLDEAETAKENFAKRVQGGGMPEEIKEFAFEDNKLSVLDILLRTNLASSNSEAKRLVEQGGVSVNEKQIKNPNEDVSLKENPIIQVGKRRFVKVLFKK